MITSTQKGYCSFEHAALAELRIFLKKLAE